MRRRDVAHNDLLRCGFRQVRRNGAAERVAIRAVTEDGLASRGPGLLLCAEPGSLAVSFRTVPARGAARRPALRSSGRQDRVPGRARPR